MKMATIRLAAAIAIAGIAMLSLACSDAKQADPTPTATPPANTQPTPNATPVATLPEPTTAPSAGLAIEWMLADNAGAGAITVRVATTAETTLELSVVRGLPDPVAPPNAKETVTKPAKLHTVSIATGQTDFLLEAVVKDSQGRTATGLLEMGTIAGRQYWGRLESAPKLDSTGNLGATATWTNLRSAGEPNIPGAVSVFSKKAGCTVAEACQAAFVGRFENDEIGGDTVAETHKLKIGFPDRTHDFQVLLIGRPTLKGTVTQFYQFDVRAGDVK